MRTTLTKLYTEFTDSEQSSGIALIIATVVSLVIANSVWGSAYTHFWHSYVGFDFAGLHLKHSVSHWVNDGLMAVFFLLIGLEIEREIYKGELSDLKNATLPIFAAIGGMLVPALIHFYFNRGTTTQDGFGIPMATDIAFALGVLALLGDRVPVTLKIFLTALAIIDDLGAILVIALFYVSDFSIVYFSGAMAIFALLLVLNRMGVKRIWIYLLLGVVMWYCMLESGVHATLAGVLLAFAIPFGNGDVHSPSYHLQHVLHKPVAFIIMPIFALANTGIMLSGDWVSGLTSANSMGISAGLLIGKPVGILLMCWLAIKFGISQLPEEVNWQHLIGASFLGGIGFTMSIFITLLAFNDAGVVQISKISVLFTSLIAGVIGYSVLRMVCKSNS
ncbi:MAG: Na+/H+ antiporter NhaA [Burkholderiaceae bacterium]|nr:Na+/H+ antiporter NhaA [Burkholderiaceae bacterium]